MMYNIYYGSIGKTLECKYKFTRSCKNETEALDIAEKSAASLYYKNEGKYGLPSYNDIVKEAEITGLDVEQLYKDHIDDMMRFYVIPTDKDTIPKKKLKF